MMSNSYSAYTESQALPPPIQYRTHSSYYSKFEVTCYKDKGTHQQGMKTNCHFKQSFRVSEVNIQWALHYLYTKTTREVDKFSITDNFNSLIESTINLIQTASKKMQLPQYRSHATGLQTVWKLVQNDLNSTPYAFTLGGNANNSPMLKLISPNSLLVGRINTRTSSGPLQLPTGPSQPMARVEQLYSAWYDVFYDTLLPLMITTHQFCQEGPEPGIPHPQRMCQEEYGNLTHTTWTPEDEALDCVVDRQQQPTDGVFMDNIVTLETSPDQGDR